MHRNEIKGMVSAILPTMEGRLPFLKISIDRIINQTYKNWELIVVLDGKFDDAKKYIESLNDSRIRIIQLEENSGSVSIPRAIGISWANGEFIAPIDDDVFSELTKFDALVSLLKIDSKYQLAYGDRYNTFAVLYDDQVIVNEDDSYLVHINNWTPKEHGSWGVDGGQYIYRRSVYDNIGHYVFVNRACDWETAKAIWKAYPNSFIKAQVVVCTYLWHETNRSLDDSNKNRIIDVSKFKKYFKGSIDAPNN